MCKSCSKYKDLLHTVLAERDELLLAQPWGLNRLMHQNNALRKALGLKPEFSPPDQTLQYRGVV